jgi:hypothetical protein
MTVLGRHGEDASPPSACDWWDMWRGEGNKPFMNLTTNDVPRQVCDEGDDGIVISGPCLIYDWWNGVWDQCNYSVFFS